MKDISDTQPTECDRQQIEYTGNIQGGAGNVIFVSYPEGDIVAADRNVRSIPWIQKRDQGANTATADSSNSDKSMNGPSNHDKLSNDEAGQENGEGGNEGNRQKEDGVREMLGAPLSSWISPTLYSLIFSGIQEMVNDKSQRSFRFLEDATIISASSYAISLSPTKEDCSVVGIEIEPILDAASSPADFYKTLLSVSRIMERYADEDVARASCDTVFKLLGSYDRAMVYQFNDDFSGEIIHEIKNEKCGNTSYLGMRFPAGDIPTTSRLMYIKNGLRYIENSSATNVPIITKYGGGGGHGDDDDPHIPAPGEAPTPPKGEMDLSHIRMRSVVKAHIMYLENMGVKCSMSIAIVVEGKLWGLLAFHGYTTPFKPSLHQRIACETITSMLSVKMEALMKKSQSDRVIKLSEIMMQWEQDHSLTSNFQRLGKCCVNEY